MHLMTHGWDSLSRHCSQKAFFGKEGPTTSISALYGWSQKPAGRIPGTMELQGTESMWMACVTQRVDLGQLRPFLQSQLGTRKQPAQPKSSIPG